MNKPVVLDVFCGCGGFSKGFKDNGFECVGIDNNGDCLCSYERNIGKTKNFDLSSEEHLKELIAFAKKLNPLVIIGSPPCQQFSQANQKRTRDLTLITAFLSIVREVEPKYWIMEEVKEVAKFLPFTNVFPVVPIIYYQANWFGLNHRRKRLFAGHFVHAPPTNIQPILFGTPTTKYHASGSFHKDYSVDYVKMFGRGPTINDKLKDMGFPPDYSLCDGMVSQHRQVGNAVCPPISFELAKGILEVENNGTAL